MSKSLLLFFFLISVFFPLAQTIDPQKLQNEISALNNERKYNSSIIKLEEIINSKTATPYDKYCAFLQKSYTYKRLYNYSEALDNLDQALAMGRKSDRKNETEGRVLIEKLFISFDLQNNDEVNQYVAEIKPEHLTLLDKTTYSFFISLLAILDIRKHDYENGEKKLNQAIALLEEANPEDLPNIYRKKNRTLSTDQSTETGIRIL